MFNRKVGITKRPSSGAKLNRAHEIECYTSVLCCLPHFSDVYKFTPTIYKTFAMIVQQSQLSRWPGRVLFRSLTLIFFRKKIKSIRSKNVRKQKMTKFLRYFGQMIEMSQRKTNQGRMTLTPPLVALKSILLQQEKISMGAGLHNSATLVQGSRIITRYNVRTSGDSFYE